MTDNDKKQAKDKNSVTNRHKMLVIVQKIV